MKKGAEKNEVSQFPVSDGFEPKPASKGRGCNPLFWLFGSRTQRNMDAFLKEHDKRTKGGEGQAPQPK
ncbi:hypothetical protein KBC80_01140 [Candidatus Woesebacteria bacterium]|jgi:hypothetical protein|nr:hypothetical protein [Candidatus Woesebacteria bacterium]